MSLNALYWNAIFDKLLDPYEVKARLFPSLLVLSPAILFLILLYGRTSPAVVGLSAVLTTCGGPYLLSSFVRTWGQRAQDRLILVWGAQPSTIILRHRDTILPLHTRLRYHELIMSRLGVIMPSFEYEQSNPAAADQSYAAAADALRPLTNDRKAFPFIFKELVAYGFNRNAYGSRWVGFSIAVIIALLTLQQSRAIRLISPYIFVSSIDNVNALILIFAFVMALLWCAHFTADTVRLSGFNYSRRLWEALDKVAKKTSRKPRKTGEPTN